MSQLLDERKQTESSFMSVYWKFRKETGEPEDTEGYWQETCRKVNEIGDQFNLDPYVTGILMICLDDLEKRAHEKFGHGFKYANYDLVIGTINRMRARRGLPEVGVKKA